MPRNASGVYTLPSGNPVVSGTTIESTWANTTMTDVGNEITNSIDKGGRTSPTANLPMNNFRHYGASAAAAAGQYLVFGQSDAVLTDLDLTSLVVGTIEGGPTFTISPKVPTNPDMSGGDNAASQAYVETAATRAAMSTLPTVSANTYAMAILNFIGFNY